MGASLLIPSLRAGRTLLEDQLAAVVGRVAADVLLDVGVLVVVDPHALVAGGGGQPADQAGLAHGRLALDQHRVGSAGTNRSEEKRKKKRKKNTVSGRAGDGGLLMCPQLCGEWCFNTKCVVRVSKNKTTVL